ncbi:Kanadaptin, partial [Cichlidogyrus casuarinus]
MQYGDGPSGLGWYIFDNGSKHGSFVNKRQLPAQKFIRIRVGHVLKLGQSTRLHLLQGPSEDVEEESEKTWSQLKQEKLKRSQIPISEAQEEEKTSPIGMACSWGMDDDDSESNEAGARQYNAAEFLKNLGSDSSSALTYESHYSSDPLTYLTNFFEREGIDGPEFRFVEAEYGKKVCKLDIPLEAGLVVVDCPIITGRKMKETKAHCALQACQMLDRLGELDPNKSRGVNRFEREKAQLEQNDYYSSDEDMFLDRTGDVEQRRKR